MFKLIARSLGVHALALGALLWLQPKADLQSPKTPRAHPIQVRVERGAPSQGMKKRIAQRTRSQSGRSSPQPRPIDLRPDFAKEGGLSRPALDSNDDDSVAFHRGKGPGAGSGVRNGFSRELLYTESKVVVAFDQLAAKINYRLDFPMILAENGIQGSVTLDLYFDHEGKVDEDRSRCFGGHGAIRGLFLKAARGGIVDWFANDAQRITRDQLRDQHFRADFVITRLTYGAAEMSRLGMNSYSFLRRKSFDSLCIIGNASGEPVLNAACVTAKLAGAIHHALSDRYKNELQILIDRLKQYDDAGMHGLNAAISANG